MKPSIYAVSLTLLALAGGCASPAPDHATATLSRFQELPLEIRSPVDPDVDVTFHVEPGDSRERVLASCGRPDSVINANLWAYANCQTGGKAAQQGGCDTLLVAFRDDRVIGLKLVNRAALVAALAKSPRSAAAAETRPPSQILVGQSMAD